MQQTEEWRAQRIGRISGSRAGAALGLSLWQTPDDLIRAMVREYHGATSEFSGSVATEHGTRHERSAMLAFMAKTGLHVDDCGFFPHGDTLGASPDGLVEDGGVLELKVPFSLRNEQEAKFKPLADQPSYYAQVQLEMLCAQCGHAYFAQYVAPKGDPFGVDYVPEQINIERVDIDYHWLSDHIPALIEFHARYLSELSNKAHLEPKRAVIVTDDAAAMLRIYDEACAQIRLAEEQKAAALNGIIALAGEADAEVWGRKLTKVTRAGSVSYAKAVKDLCPDADLAAYTGKESHFWKLT